MTRTEKLLAELVALPSVNPAFVPQSETTARQARLSKFGEKKVADFLASVAAKAGLEVEFQKVLPVDAERWGETPGELALAGGHYGSRGRSPHQTKETDYRSNLIAWLLPRNKIRQTIVLAPHLDTVDANESQFVPRRKRGRLYGRGACDTKGSVAAMFIALCELANAKSRPAETEIIFAGLIDEEHAQAGSRALVRSSAFRRLGPSMTPPNRLKAELQTTLAIVGEPTRLRVVTAHKGSLWFRLETRGKAAHGATPQFGQNAIHEMASIVDALETDYAAWLRKRKHPLLGAATVSVGMISGGVQPNIVPDRCAITIDRRTLPGETETGASREIAAFLNSKHLSAKISRAKPAPAPPLETNPNLPLVRQFLHSVGQSKPAGVDYFCDAAVLAGGGIPSVVFGPGDIAQAHTADEWISLAELERGKNLLLKFLKSLP
jgi:acetylornithine deacetylase/succinyl-diaminopimelate desuccinylase-like protein